MSDKLYAIKDSTLTALGDAVRNKTIGTTELSINSIFNLKYQYNSDVMFEEFNLGGAKTKIKINSITNNSGYSYGEGNFVWSKIGIALKGGYTKLPSSSEVAITISKGITFPYEVIADSGVITFVFMGGASSTDLNLDVELTALDENGNEYKYTPLEMADVINGLEIPNIQPVVLTGDCSYGCAGVVSGAYIKMYGDTISTNNITRAHSMFYLNNGENIPFDINLDSSCSSVECLFQQCNNLKELPAVNGTTKSIPTSSYSHTMPLSKIFNSCYNLRSIPNDFFWKMIPHKEWWDASNNYHTSMAMGDIFNSCYSLRQLPDLSLFAGSKHTAYYSSLYYSLAVRCYSLDEITNLPVLGVYTGNCFNGTITECKRLANFTFETNEDGSPKIAQWKNTTLDFIGVGWFASSSDTKYQLFPYNSGITADKEVKDDATYQALKDDPDWFSCNFNYSRYNHDSAVNTINSLPDCSATGTNIIKFTGVAGALTDGGAINTLTDAEIAVAAAKGWTVSLV